MALLFHYFIFVSPLTRLTGLFFRREEEGCWGGGGDKKCVCVGGEGGGGGFLRLACSCLLWAPFVVGLSWTVIGANDTYIRRGCLKRAVLSHGLKMSFWLESSPFFGGAFWGCVWLFCPLLPLPSSPPWKTCFAVLLIPARLV